MNKYFMAIILMSGLFFVGFKASAIPVCDPACDHCTRCARTIDGPTCVCIAEYDSRGDCISEEKDRCKFSFPNGQARAECESKVHEWCDCAVDNGCTDLPPGPPED